MKKVPGGSTKSMDNSDGIVAVYVAIMIAVFIGFAALAIDIGYNMVVRNQLQNAADAAALAGCNRFYARTPFICCTTFPCTNNTSIPPDWNAVYTEAASAITLNKADNKQLKVDVVAYGYWDITQPSLGLQPNTITPTANDGPAVRVTVQKTGTTNNGPIVNFFASILGIPTTDVGATSTAVAASPGTVRPGAVIPVAISKEAADQAANYSSPGNPINIGSPYHYPNSLAGQWTSFTEDTNDVPSVRGLIANGNPSMLSTGENIWIEPGTKTTLYSDIESTYAGQDVFLPIVDAVLSDTTHSAQPIAGFIGFHVISATGGSSKIITGYFTTPPIYGGNGPCNGLVDVCKLCQ